MTVVQHKHSDPLHVDTHLRYQYSELNYNTVYRNKVFFWDAVSKSIYLLKDAFTAVNFPISTSAYNLYIKASLAPKLYWCEPGTIPVSWLAEPYTNSNLWLNLVKLCVVCLVYNLTYNVYMHSPLILLKYVSNHRVTDYRKKPFGIILARPSSASSIPSLGPFAHPCFIMFDHDTKILR